jgi:SOS-response transcriptional repressor LexA
MTSQLEQLEADIIVFVDKFSKEKGHAPSLREIGHSVQISHEFARRYLIKLENRGYVRRQPNCARALSVLPAGRTKARRTRKAIAA